MISVKKINILKPLSLIVALLFNQEVRAASFDISGSTTVGQTLDSAETGLIRNGGSLSVSSIGSIAVTFNSSAAATLTNSGAITTTNNFSYGVHERGASNIIVNSGSISTAGISAIGIFSQGTGATITSSGSISTTTTGNSAYGIYSSAANATIANSGSISTAGNSGFGIYSQNTGATITNSGSISTTGGSAFGIYSQNTGATITNSGSISAAGDSSGGIVFTGNGTITNRGSIRISGVGATAIHLNEFTEGSILKNSGTIEVSGSGSGAVTILSNNTNLTNTGKIIASGSATAAITGGSGSQTIILGKGSEIIGTINLEGGTDSITVSGNGISGRVSTSNVESLSISSHVAGVVVGSDIHTVDPTGTAMLTIGVNKLTLNVQNSINSHNTQASLDNNKKSPTWINIFNSNFDRGDDTQNLAYRNQSFGFVGGYELDSKNSTGLVFGASSGNMKTKSSSFKTDVNSFFLGGYKNIDLAKSTTLNFDLIAGYERYNSERLLVDNINGYQIAKSDFNNLFISPSATLEHKFKITKIFELNPMAKMSYTSSFFGEVSEAGATSSNISTKSRNAQIFNSRIGLNAVLNLQNTKFELGTGFDTRIIKEGKVRASINNNDFRYSTNNDKNVNGHYIRAAAYIIDLKNFSLVGSFEKRKADGNENEYFGQIGAGYRF